MTTLNINDEVEVTLTDYGREVLRDHYRELGMEPPACKMTEKPIKLPIWDLMRTFGPVIFMGMPRMPFERNEIRLVRTPTTSPLATGPRS